MKKMIKIRQYIYSASGLISFQFLGMIQNPILFCTNSCFSSSSSSSSVRYDKDESFELFLISKFQHACFKDVDDAVSLFNQRILVNPLPSSFEFGRFLYELQRRKHYVTIVFLCKRIELLGVSLDGDSLTALVSSFCSLQHVDFGFSILGDRKSVV